MTDEEFKIIQVRARSNMTDNEFKTFQKLCKDISKMTEDDVKSVETCICDKVTDEKIKNIQRDFNCKLTDAQIEKYKTLCNGIHFIKLIALQDKISKNGTNTEILDFVRKFDYLVSPVRTEIFTRFNTELEKYSNGQQFNLLFMLDFIAELKDAYYTIRHAAKENDRRFKSEMVKSKNSHEALEKLEPYLLKVDKKWGSELTDEDDENSINKKETAKADVWKECEKNIKKIKVNNKRICKSLKQFSGRFEQYLDICRERHERKTPIGRILKEYNKSPKI